MILVEYLIAAMAITDWQTNFTRKRRNDVVVNEPALDATIQTIPENQEQKDLMSKQMKAILKT